MKRRLPAKVRIVRSLKKILLTVLILTVVLVAIPGFVFYKVTRPGMAEETLDPSYYLLKFSGVRVQADDGREIGGWWIAGKMGAPGIVLSPGFGMSRSDVLSLANALHAEGFNILVYVQRGSSSSTRKTSTFGLKESRDLIAVIRFAQGIPEIDSSRIGVWGVDVGAYAALAAAASFPEVRAVAADSVFASAYEFLDIRIGEEYGIRNRFLQLGCRQMLKLFCAATGYRGGAEVAFENLSGCSILLITGENRRELALLTSALYSRLPSKKEIMRFETSRVHMMKGKQFEDYDGQVTDFFLQNL
jgi:pimeloyl-ACP methyl ester carboxylesterase